MKAIFVSDANPAYIGFWEPQAKHMWSRHGLRSLLYYIAAEPNTSLFTSEYAEVRHIPIVSTSPAIIQALFAKWYFPGQEDTTERLFICDIDCFVLSPSFVKHVAEGAHLFHLKPMAEGNVPGYYVAGTPSQLRTFFRADTGSFEEFCLRALRESTYVSPTLTDVSPFSLSASPDWKYFGSEEHYAGKCGTLYREAVDSSISSPIPNINRICRSFESAYNKESLQKGEYVDYHCPRPFETYASVIRSILDSLTV